MPVRVLVVWLALLIVAVGNGGFREAILVPTFGPDTAHLVSTAMLAVAILIVAWLAVPWIRPATERDAVLVGLAWLALTVLFEFGFGRLRGVLWSRLVADYDLRQGRIWVLIPLVAGLAPWLVTRVRGIGVRAGGLHPR